MVTRGEEYTAVPASRSDSRKLLDRNFVALFDSLKRNWIGWFLVVRRPEKK